MSKAIQEARKGMKKKHGGPFGSVLVKDGQIIASDHNRVINKHDATCHAEINVIRKASKKLKSFNLSDCEIYTTGKPCKMCEGAINWAKIKKVYYGNSYKDALNMGFDDESGNNSDIKYERMECAQTALLIEEWNNLNRKSIY